MGVCTNGNRIRRVKGKDNNTTYTMSDISRNNNTINSSFQSNNLNRTDPNININNEIKKTGNDIYKALEEHNIIRKNYNLKPLKINDDLCELAQRYADKCAETESLDHCPLLYKGNIIGENIKEIDDEKIDVSKICEEWINEKMNIDDKNGKFNSIASHASQIIWRETKEVGFGFSTSPNNKTYFVAYYYPAGNIISNLKNNL